MLQKYSFMRINWPYWQKGFFTVKTSISDLNLSYYQEDQTFGVLTIRMYNILMGIATLLANIGAPVN